MHENIECEKPYFCTKRVMNISPAFHRTEGRVDELKHVYTSVCMFRKKKYLFRRRHVKVCMCAFQLAVSVWPSQRVKNNQEDHNGRTCWSFPVIFFSDYIFETQKVSPSLQAPFLYLGIMSPFVIIIIIVIIILLLTRT